ncbi:MAG: pilin [Patescibacteria group bacterium]|nr:pilin [Patescibacteria group bacterium]
MKKTLIFCSSIFFLISFVFVSPAQAEDDLCCPGGFSSSFWTCPLFTDRSAKCCRKNGLFNYDVVNKIACDSDDAGITPAGDKITQEDLNKLNPFLLFSSKTSQFYSGDEFILAMFINELVNFVFPIAGLILFVMIVWGGFEMLTSAAGKKGLDAGKQRVISALIGFFLLFCSYWIIQIIELITQVNILG